MKSLYRMPLLCILLCCSFSLSIMQASSTNDSHTKTKLIFPPQDDCNTSPVISCPANYYSCPGDDTSPSNTGFATAVAGEADCPAPIVTYSDFIESEGPCDGEMVIKRTWNAAYPDTSDPWLMANCIQIIRLFDDEAPQLASCPNNINITSTGSCSEVITWTAPTASDNCSDVTLSSSHNSGDTFTEGTTTVSYTATDACGNQSTCSFTVTIECVCGQDPILDCPDDFNTCPGSNYPPSIAGAANATAGGPNCGSPIVSFDDVTISSGDCGAEIIERTWIASDPDNSDLNTTCIQVITIEDVTAPSITNCPNDITVDSETNTPVSVTWTVPTVSDGCSAVDLSSTAESGDTFDEGTSTVTYTATDDCENESICSFNVTVVYLCNEAPIITCPADYFTCPGSPYSPSIAGEAVAIEGGPNCPIPTISFSDDVSESNECGEQVIERFWTATYPNGNPISSTCVQIITIEDNTAPELSNCPADITLQASGDCSQIVTWPEPTATDNCNDVTITSTHAPGSSFDEGTTLVVYTATDACGNSVSCDFSITVECGCNEVPSITCPDDFVGCVGTNMTPSITGTASATAGGPNCETPIVTYSDDVWTNGPCGTKTIERYWTATDPDNPTLTATCLQIITLEDNEAPVISYCPTDITVSGSVPVSWTTPQATDNCTDVIIESDYTNGQIFPIGTTTVTITAMDLCTNTSSCTFTVTVESALQLDCPDNMIVDCNTDGGAIVHFDPPTVTSECEVCPYEGGNPIAGYMYMGELNGHHYYCSMEPATWEAANSAATSYGGSLAVIESEEENEFLANILTLQSAYIGLSDRDLEGELTWVDGSPLGYTNWYPNQPNDYGVGQDYVEMLNNGQWNDQYAHAKLEYIMELSCGGGLTQIDGPSSGSVFPIGTTTVSYSATDECGNSATCTFEVTVESAINIECYADATFTCPYNASGVIVNWDTPNVHSCCNTDCNTGGAIAGYVYMGEYNGSHYYCSVDNATWENAQALAMNIGGNLATINDAAENTFLASKLPNNGRAWIGLNDADLEGEMNWASGEDLTYSNWYPGQPNDYNYQQDYVELLGNGQWNDQYNHYALEYIVEIPSCNSIEQITGPASGTLFPAGSTTTITYVASDDCGNVDTCSFDITIEIPACTSGGTSSEHAWIEKVAFNTIANASGNNGGYADFTNNCTTVLAGNVYPITLKPGYAASSVPVYWKVWVDYNMDGDYDDASEYVGYGGGINPLQGYMTIPTNVWNGSTTMRVAMKKGSYPSGPCESFEYGETEDYCIIIGGAEKPGRRIGEERKEMSRTSAVEFSSGVALESVKRSVEEENFELTISPNPSIYNSEIRLGDGSKSMAPDLIQIFDMNGNAVNKRVISNTNDGTYKIDASDLPSGIYLILATKNGKTYQSKLMVTK